MNNNTSSSLLTACLAIPTYNREEILVQTLKSAFALQPRPQEILVIDQTVEHEETTTRFLEEAVQKVKIRLIRQQPPSLTAARNRAIVETTCDIILFVDDDVEFPNDFLTRHLGNFQNERVVAVAGGVDQQNPPRYPPPPRVGKWPRWLDYKYFSVYSQKRTAGVATFMGCNHSVRVETLRKLGGYDMNYIGSAFREDTDMAVRIWKSGGIIVYDPEARLHHLAAPTGGCRIPQPLKTNPEWWVAFNRIYFAWKHLFPHWEFWWMVFFRDQRESAFRKHNLFRPWKLPWAFLSYWYAVVKAGFTAKKRKKDENTGIVNLGSRV